MVERLLEMDSKDKNKNAVPAVSKNRILLKRPATSHSNTLRTFNPALLGLVLRVLLSYRFRLF